METAAHALGAEAVREQRPPCTAAERDDRSAGLECDHFSMRGYVALRQKKDPKLRSLQIFCDQQQYNEDHDNSSPLLVAKYQRWNCSNCLDRVTNIGRRTTASGTISMQQDGVNDDCSISIIRTLPYSVGSRRRFSCTQQWTQGNDADQSTLSKSAQECNSKCSSPENKAVTAVNVPATSAEKNVPETFVEKSIPDTKDLQGSPNNLEVPEENILNGISMDVGGLPDVPQMISSTEGTVTQTPCSSKPCEVPNGDENRTPQDISDVDHTDSGVRKPISGHRGSKQLSGQKSSQVRNQGQRRAALRRNTRSDCKKKNNKSSDMADISDLKFSQRKPKKTRLISELIDAQIGGSADAIEDDHAKTGDLCESDKSKVPLQVGNDDDTPVGNQKVDEIQSTVVKNKERVRGVDNVADGSSLMNWLQKTHKKVRTEKRDSGHKNFDSSAVSNSNPDIPASSDMNHDFLPSVGDMGQEKVQSTASVMHGNENTQNNSLEKNMQKADGLCHNESEKLKQRFLSNGKSTILLKRKVLPPAISRDDNTENSTVKRSVLREVESEGTVQRCLTKVSLGKRKIQNESGLHKQNIPKNKKKSRLKMHEKQNVIDDIPMDIVELLARNQHQRQMTIDSDSLENSNTQPKIAAVNCAEIAAKDGPIDTLAVLDTNFQKPPASESKKKSLQAYASSITEAVSVHSQDLRTQNSSHCHTASSTEVPNGHHPESHMQNALQVHALPIAGSFNAYPQELRIPDILECTQDGQEQQTHFCRDEEVTIACTSPIFSRHQHIAEVPSQSWSNKGERKLMWDSFKTASRNSPASTYGFQFRSGIREVDSTPIPVYGASNDYATHQPVIAAVDHLYTKEAVGQIQPRSVPSTALTLEAGRLYDQRMAGQSGLYPKEPMPATHLLRLMDSSSARGFTNYQRANRHQLEHQTQNLSSQSPQPNQYNASPSTSYGSHLIEKVPLTLQDLAHQVEQNLHRPLRPHPRVGVLGSLLQQDIASWSENCGTQSGHRLGVSKGKTSFDMKRKGNYETLNSGMLSTGWNALQLGSVTSVANPERPLPRYGAAQPRTGGTRKTVHPLDKLVRKDICQTNRNPADFTVISDKNQYMINL